MVAIALPMIDPAIDQGLEGKSMEVVAPLSCLITGKIDHMGINLHPT
jgi:hypothetical protein